LKAGEAKVEQSVSGTGKNIDGWTLGGLEGGDSAFFHGDWLKRAAVANAGIYANDPIEATYPLTRTDAAGEPLGGSKAVEFIWASDSSRLVSGVRGGEGGIRTHGTVAGTPHFECGAFDLSATSPHDRITLAGGRRVGRGRPLAAHHRVAKPVCGAEAPCLLTP
jgi:hypothetical protein